MIEKYIAALKPHEMACRICEAATGWKRPIGKSAQESLAELAAMGEIQREAVEGFYRASLAAAEYLEEAINEYQRVQ